MTDFFELVLRFANQFGLSTMILLGLAWWFNKKDNQHRADFRKQMEEDKEDRRLREDRYVKIAEENTKAVTKLITTMDVFIELNKR